MIAAEIIAAGNEELSKFFPSSPVMSYAWILFWVYIDMSISSLLDLDLSLSETN